MAQIRFRIDTVQTAGADHPVQQCSTLAAVIAAKEHKDGMTFIYSR
ncbi:Minor tail protein Z (GpZ), partial [Escherichia coli O104:H4 str. E112/10]